jgi:hypothetical protein
MMRRRRIQTNRWSQVTGSAIRVRTVSGPDSVSGSGVRRRTSRWTLTGAAFGRPAALRRYSGPGRSASSFGGGSGPSLRLAVISFDGGCYAADDLSRLWPPGLDRCGSLPRVRAPNARRDSNPGRTGVLLLLGTSHHPLPELREAELRPASPVHLRLPRQRRGVRTAVRKLLLLRRGLEEICSDYLRYWGDLVPHLLVRRFPAKLQ